eukprot:6198170-Pleurochrysis_carterae.AAC.3
MTRKFIPVPRPCPSQVITWRRHPRPRRRLRAALCLYPSRRAIVPTSTFKRFRRLSALLAVCNKTAGCQRFKDNLWQQYGICVTRGTVVVMDKHRKCMRLSERSFTVLRDFPSCNV